VVAAKGDRPAGVATVGLNRLGRVAFNGQIDRRDSRCGVILTVAWRRLSLYRGDDDWGGRSPVRIDRRTILRRESGLSRRRPDRRRLWARGRGAGGNASEGSKAGKGKDQAGHRTFNLMLP